MFLPFGFRLEISLIGVCSSGFGLRALAVSWVGAAPGEL